MQMFLTPEEKIIEQLRTENAALKEQMAHIKEIEFPTKCIAIADIWKNKVTLLDETITQQAEAIRLKDAALDWCIGEFNLRLDDIDLSQETISVLSARHIQHSPDILQARDERVAEACANLVNRFISGDGILNDTWVHEIEEALRTNEWRKHL